MERFSLGYSLLAVQNALLKVVTPQLRAVVVDFSKAQQLYIRFYYDGEASEEAIDLWQCSITEASADLGVSCLLDDGIERLDYPNEIPFRGRYAYLRKEPYFPSTQKPTKYPLISREIVDFQEEIGLFVSPVDGEQVNTSWGIIHYASDGTHIVPARPLSYKIEIFPIAYAMLSIQRALLDSVTPELRAVIADVSSEDNLLYVRYYYDKEVDEQTIDLWECAITESWADFGSDYDLDAAVVRLDYPLKVPFRGRYAYLRKE